MGDQRVLFIMIDLFNLKACHLLNKLIDLTTPLKAYVRFLTMVKELVMSLMQSHNCSHGL